MPLSTFAKQREGFILMQHGAIRELKGILMECKPRLAMQRPQVNAGPSERLCLLSYRRATLCAGLASTVFAVMVFVHEIAIEGGFTIKNYAVIAFCFVWLFVDSLLFLGLVKKAHFLLLPWMILICLFSPLYFVGIVVGVKVIDGCARHHDDMSCTHQVHMFGSRRSTEAGTKLTFLILMCVINLLSLPMVYKYMRVLSWKISSLSGPKQGYIYDNSVDDQNKRHRNKVYSRFGDETETSIPLWDSSDDVTDMTT